MKVFRVQILEPPPPPPPRPAPPSRRPAAATSKAAPGADPSPGGRAERPAVPAAPERRPPARFERRRDEPPRSWTLLLLLGAIACAPTTDVPSSRVGPGRRHARADADAARAPRRADDDGDRRPGRRQRLLGGRRADLTVPAGAVATPTDADHHARSRTLARGAVGPAFRLGPEGTTFASPVTLTFKAPERYPLGHEHRRRRRRVPGRARLLAPRRAGRPGRRREDRHGLDDALQRLGAHVADRRGRRRRGPSRSCRRSGSRSPRPAARRSSSSATTRTTRATSLTGTLTVPPSFTVERRAVRPRPDHEDAPAQHRRGPQEPAAGVPLGHRRDLDAHLHGAGRGGHDRAHAGAVRHDVHQPDPLRRGLRGRAGGRGGPASRARTRRTAASRGSSRRPGTSAPAPRTSCAIRRRTAASA